MRQNKVFAQLVSGSGIATMANAAAALLATKWLPIDDRGVMVAALTVASVVSLAAGLGTGAALRALRPVADPAERPQLDHTYRSLTVATVATGALLAAVSCVVIAPFIDPLLGAADVVAATSMMAGYLVALRQVTEAWFARGAFGAAARVSALSAVAGVAALVVVGMSWPDTAALIAAQAAGSTLVLTAMVARVVRLRGRLTGDGRAARRLVRLGASSVGMPLASAIVLRADRLILGAVAGPQYLAVYALAATASEAARLGPTALAQMAAHQVAHDRSVQSIRGLYLRSTVFVVGAGAVMVVVSFFAIPPIFGADYAAATPLLAIMTVGEVGYGLFVIASMGLLGGGWGRRSSTTAVAAAVVCIPVYWAGSAIAGPFGCAVASAVLYLLMGAVATARIRTSLVTRLSHAEGVTGAPT